MVRRSRIVDSIVLLVAAYLQAAMLVRCTGALLSATDLPSPPQAGETEPTPPRAPADPARITRLFAPTAPAPVVGCDSLAASIISEAGDPEHSLASLRGLGMVRTGSQLGGRQVVRIERAAVVLADGTSVCRAPLAPIGAEPKSAEPGSGAVSRELRDQLLSDPRRLLAGARVEPEREGPRIVGLRLLALRPGSLLEKLGLRAGDRLRSINGISMVDPSDAARLWSILSRAERFVVEIERDGQSSELSLRID